MHSRRVSDLVRARRRRGLSADEAARKIGMVWVANCRARAGTRQATQASAGSGSRRVLAAVADGVHSVTEGAAAAASMASRQLSKHITQTISRQRSFLGGAVRSDALLGRACSVLGRQKTTGGGMRRLHRTRLPHTLASVH
eukprot:3161929-Prymnesium_polylepis.1